MARISSGDRERAGAVGRGAGGSDPGANPGGGAPRRPSARFARGIRLGRPSVRASPVPELGGAGATGPRPGGGGEAGPAVPNGAGGGPVLEGRGEVKPADRGLRCPGTDGGVGG